MFLDGFRKISKTERGGGEGEAGKGGRRVRNPRQKMQLIIRVKLSAMHLGLKACACLKHVKCTRNALYEIFKIYGYEISTPPATHYLKRQRIHIQLTCSVILIMDLLLQVATVHILLILNQTGNC